jgi:hypothetical protein
LISAGSLQRRRHRHHHHHHGAGTQSPPRSRFPRADPLWPVFMSYVLSFIYVGIYWNKLQYGCHPSLRRFAHGN